MEEMVIGRWLSEAVMSRKWCDVSILCSGRHFWAHRLVLSSASPFIRGLLLSRPSDDIPTTIVLADFSHEIVEALLQYIYSGEVSVFPEQVQDFLSLSEALKVHVDIANIKGMNINNKKVVNSRHFEEKIDEVDYFKQFGANKDYYLSRLIHKKSDDMKNGCYEKLEVVIKSDKSPIDKLDNIIEDKQSLQFNTNMIAENSEATDLRKNAQNGYNANRVHQTAESYSALNLSNNGSFASQLSINYPSHVPNLQSKSDGRLSHTSRNEKLVRPIPSLMPIDSLVSILNPSERRSPMKKMPDLLDLSTLRGSLSYNKNSAFERVKHSSNVNLQRNGYLQNNFDHVNPQAVESHKPPLRSGFEITINENTKNDSRVIKKIPYNKVLDSPWSARGPIFYRCKNKSVVVAGPVSSQPSLNDHRQPNDKNNNNFEKNEVATIQQKIIEANGPQFVNGTIEPNDTGTRRDNFMLASILDSKKSKKTPEFVKNIEEIPTNDVRLQPTSTNQNQDESTEGDACVLKCPSCFKMFTSRAVLSAHAATHVARARYRCDQCDKSFSQLRNYKYHVSVHKGTKEFAATCNVCGKYFNDRGYLSSHMKIHRNRKEYQCPHCPKSFNQRVAYNMHVRIHTGVKPHQCEACGKAFSRKMLLKQHSRTHSGEKPYACSSCGKRFADRSNMTLHMRLHSGVKPFSCNLCPKSFTKKHHLKTHLNYHTGNKPYACSKCGLTFSQSSNMRTHMKKCSVVGNQDEMSPPNEPMAT